MGDPDSLIHVIDRLIVAHALAHGSLLLTADETILAHCTAARWG